MGSFPDEWEYNVERVAIGQRATITIPAANDGISHVCTGIDMSAFLQGPAILNFYAVRLVDGAIVLWQRNISLQAAAGDLARDEVTSDLVLMGQPGTFMTIEFFNPIPAGVAAASQYISIKGYDI